MGPYLLFVEVKQKVISYVQGRYAVLALSLLELTLPNQEPAFPHISLHPKTSKSVPEGRKNNLILLGKSQAPRANMTRAVRQVTCMCLTTLKRAPFTAEDLLAAFTTTHYQVPMFIPKLSKPRLQTMPLPSSQGPA